VETGKRKLDPILEDFLNEYESYIDYRVNVTIDKSKNYHFGETLREDAKQFVMMNLVKIYSKRFKYNSGNELDWDFVIKTSIRRKVMDFSIRYARLSRKLYFDNQIINFSHGDSEGFCQNFIDSFTGSDTQSDSIHSGETKLPFERVDFFDYLTFLKNQLEKNKKVWSYFTDWDRELIDVIMELYNYENGIDYEDVVECMGYDESDKQKFVSKLKSFNKKLEICMEKGILEKTCL